MTETRTIPLELLERAINSIGNFDLSYFGDKAEAAQLIADLEAVKVAEESRAELIVREIWDALYGQGFEVANLHRNGDLEPLGNIFDFNDWTLETTAREGQKGE